LLFRNDRHGHGGKSIAYTNADGDTYANIYTDASPISYPDSHAYANSYTHSYPDIYANLNAYANSYAHASAISYPDSHAYANICAHAYPDIYADAYANVYANLNAHANGIAHTNAYDDALHGKMYADAKAGSDSGAASHTTPGDSCHAHSRSYAEPRAWGSYSCRG
jgi:hypothetical protein